MSKPDEIISPSERKVSNISRLSIKALLFNSLLEKGIQDEATLYGYIKEFLGFSIPTESVCSHHVSPWTAVKDIFFEKKDSTFLFGSRSSGKTRILSILNHVEATFKSRIQIACAGAIMTQAQKNYEYTLGYYDDPLLASTLKSSIQSKTVLENGSEIMIMSSSLTAMNGQHPAKFRLDEIELIDWYCISGYSLINTIRNRSVHPHGVPIKDLVDKKDQYVYCYDSTEKRYHLRKIVKVKKTGHKKVLKISYWWWSGREHKVRKEGSIKVTPDHRMMLFSGEYREAQDLAIGSRLKAFAQMNFGTDRHPRINVSSSRSNVVEHQFIWEEIHGAVPEGHVIHHKDHDKWNSELDNLELMTYFEHIREHHCGVKRSDVTKENLRLAAEHRGEAWRDKLRKSRKKYWNTRKGSRPWTDKRTLEEAFSQFNLQSELAEHWSCSVETLRVWSRKHDIPYRDPSDVTRMSALERLKDKPYTDQNVLRAQYVEQVMTVQEMADHHGVDWSTIQCWLEFHGIPRRSGSAAQRVEVHEENHKVFRIEECEAEDVYSMEVEEHHNFVANGVVVANCIQEGFSMTQGQNGWKAQDTMSSTRKFGMGTVQRLLDEAEQRNIEVYPFCIWESVEKCSRQCKGDPVWGDCPIYSRKDTITGREVLLCGGLAHQGSGFYPVQDLIKKLLIMDANTFKSQWECLYNSEIDTPKGRSRIQDLVGTTPLVYSWSLIHNCLVLNKAEKVWKSGRQVKVFDVITDEGTITCTAGQEFLLTDGTYKKAIELEANDRIKSLYRATFDNNGTAHRYIVQGYKSLIPEHRFVYEQIYGEIPAGHVIHHKDGNGLNNDPSNLQALSVSEHASAHMRERGWGWEVVACLYCGKDVKRKKSLSWKRWCSVECRKSFSLQERFVTKNCLSCHKEFTSLISSERTNCSPECQYTARKQDTEMASSECPTCKKTLTYRKSTPKVYCSKECWGVQPKIEHTCKACSKVFMEYASRNAKYCSTQCRSSVPRKSRGGSETKDCLQCGKEFTAHKSDKKKFCSKTCGYTHRSEQGRVLVPCKYCKTSFSVKKSQAIHAKYCSKDCRVLDKKVLNHTVISVKYAGYEDVYDISVPGTHNFSANGMFVHNCKVVGDASTVYGSFFSEDLHVKRTEEEFLTKFEELEGEALGSHHQRLVGIDFGGQFACVRMVRSLRNKRRFYVWEVYFSRKDVILDVHVKHIKKMQWFGQGHEVWYGDTAARQDIIEFNSKGVPVRPARKDDVFAGINLIKSLLEYQSDGEPGIIINGARCEALVTEFNSYAYKILKSGLPDQDSIVKATDHCISGYSLILTYEGEFRIMDLVGTMPLVRSWDHTLNEFVWNRAVRVWLTQRDQEVFSVTSSLRTIKATKDHRFMLEDGSYRVCEDLCVGDVLKAENSQGVEVVTSVRFSGFEDVYCMHVPGTHNFTAEGFLVRNCLDAMRYALYTHLLGGHRVRTRKRGNF